MMNTISDGYRLIDGTLNTKFWLLLYVLCINGVQSYLGNVVHVHYSEPFLTITHTYQAVWV